MASNVYQKYQPTKNSLKRYMKRLVGPRVLRTCLEVTARPAALIEEARSVIDLCKEDWAIDFDFMDKNN